MCCSQQTNSYVEILPGWREYKNLFTLLLKKMRPEWSKQKPMDTYSPCAVFHNHVEPGERVAPCFTQFYFLSDRGCVMCLYKGRNGSNCFKGEFSTLLQNEGKYDLPRFLHVKHNIPLFARTQQKPCGCAPFLCIFEQGDLHPNCLGDFALQYWILASNSNRIFIIVCPFCRSILKYLHKWLRLTEPCWCRAILVLAVSLSDDDK